MRNSVFHRRCISVLFIALYAFIATPTATWHHHTVVFKGKKQEISDVAQGSSLDTASIVSCKICSHHYSVFDNDSTLPIIQSVEYGITQSGISIAPCFTYSSRILSDRAPPTI
ncbi:MAG: hypothetical protein FGM61_01055 [Sediminibacterium sp.]|nr:hypothetical protein [Sediminibacterium sp.]